MPKEVRITKYSWRSCCPRWWGYHLAEHFAARLGRPSIIVINEGVRCTNWL